ncbi:hypothetical protein MOMA_04395 [Moraxella macacae 0408225]|uniref:Uncharacterized protein n=1 Tax=Moraxella macacae 0408225 TaxID=1230338 RepID=L2F9Q3_9GAMM|nr:hypothetical protein [Moraxella macacae]ELA09615.1 hypothetical protein MOMA_04395 [Moraxella macacae 0408225]
MLTFADKKTLLHDRYQALILPIPVSGVFRHRLLLRVQTLYPKFYQTYRQACERGELALGQNLIYELQDVFGMGVAGAISRPKFITAMAIREFAETAVHLNFIKSCLQQFEPILQNWGRYDGYRRVAILADDALILPNNCDFDNTILPLFEQYLQPISSLNTVIYR